MIIVICIFVFVVFYLGTEMLKNSEENEELRGKIVRLNNQHKDKVDGLYKQLTIVHDDFIQEKNRNETENQIVMDLIKKKQQLEEDCELLTKDFVYMSLDDRPGWCINNQKVYKQTKGFIKEDQKFSWECGQSFRGDSDLTAFVRYCFNLAGVVVSKGSKGKSKEELAGKLKVHFDKMNKLLPNDWYITDVAFQNKLDQILLKQEYEELKNEGMIYDFISDTKKLEDEIKKEEKEIAKLKDELKETDSLLRIKELEEIIANYEKEIKENKAAIKGKAGWIYVISSPSFKRENQYKIGLTRRKEPMNRIDELSTTAGLPFTYNVHALFYVEDCFKTEKMLHDAFRDKILNSRKEHFMVELSKIEDKVVEYGYKVEFEHDVENLDYEINKERLKRMEIVI